MILQEPQSTTVMREVIRCDVCCKKIVDRYHDLYIVTYNHLITKTHIKTEKYQLCEMCAFNRMNDMDNRRDRIQSGVTDAEQEALLRGLFDKPQKKKKRW